VANIPSVGVMNADKAHGGVRMCLGAAPIGRRIADNMQPLRPDYELQCIRSRREIERQIALTIQVELHIGLGTSVETVLARVISEARLSRLLSSNVHVEINGRVEVTNGIVVDIEEVVVEEGSKVLLGGYWLVEVALWW
jgi:hypothetical protein